MIIDDFNRLVNDRSYYLKKLKKYNNLCHIAWIIALCIIFLALLFKIKIRLTDAVLLSACWILACTFLFFRGLEFYAAKIQQLKNNILP